LKNTQVSHFINIRLVGADRRTDRQTERHDEADSRFSLF